MHTLITLLPAQPGILASARLALDEARRRWQARRDAKLTADALAKLDERTLHDLGVDRSQIESLSIELQGLQPTTLRRTRNA